jgi:hypothetical protein
MRYQSRPEIVNAVRWWKHGDHPRVLKLDHESWGYLLGRIVHPGVWIVEGPLVNQIYILDDDIFRKRFVRIQDEDEPRTVGH